MYRATLTISVVPTLWSSILAAEVKLVVIISLGMHGKATQMFLKVCADVESYPAILAFSTVSVTKNFCIKGFKTSHLVVAFHREFEISVALFLVICVSQPHNMMGLFLGRRHVFRLNSSSTPSAKSA